MKKCFISSDVRVKPASFAGYAPVTVIESMTTAWLHLASDVVNGYNAIVASFDPFIRFIAKMPVLDSQAWIESFRSWIESNDFHSICTICDECRAALQHGRPCTIKGLWLPYIGGFADTVGPAWSYLAIQGDPYDVQARLLRLFLTLVTFPRKTPVERESNIDSALNDWIAFESKSNPEYELIDIVDMRQVLSEWLSDYSPTCYPCHHGPGTTSEGLRSNADKYLHMTFTPNVLAWSASRGIDVAAPHLGAPLYSRVIAVPKTWKGPRIISCEPTCHQWAQQALKENLYQYIYRHKYLHKRIVLPDQSVNRSVCVAGSIDMSYDTIDLTAASDSITLELVKRIFPARLLDDLLLTRSEYSLLNGRVYRLRKFAPMGSAVCFPVESLVFGAACEVVCRRRGKGRWWAYGDDLIISHDCYNDLIDLLTSLGFVPNESKSFHEGHYRESCGIEAFYGFDVTPIYYRVECDIFSKFIRPECYLSLVALANQSISLFPNLRKWVIGRLHSMRVKVSKSKSRPLRPLWTLDPSNTACLLTKTCAERKYRFRLDGPQVIETYGDIVAVRPPKSSVEFPNSQPIIDWLSMAQFKSQRGFVLQEDQYSHQKLRDPSFRIGWVCMFGEEHFFA